YVFSKVIEGPISFKVLRRTLVFVLILKSYDCENLTTKIRLKLIRKKDRPLEIAKRFDFGSISNRFRAVKDNSP
ncbi:hypothetical protein LEP1GSC162_1012, partial [Leptospira santarosai str. CBC1531]